MRATDKRATVAVEQAIYHYFSKKSRGRNNDVLPVNVVATHLSQYQYDLDNNSIGSTDKFSIIEPTVLCEHCGYCRSHGY